MDFASGAKGGDIIDLYRHNSGNSTIEAAKYLQETYTGKTAEPITYAQKQPREQYKFIKPPKDAAPPDFSRYNNVYTFRDTDGHALFYVARRNNPDGSKTIHPYSFTDTGFWVPKIWPKNRPLYELDAITKLPDKKVLIVEGEKAADAALRFMPESYVVTTWTGGANAIDRTDWSTLKGRDVLLWPDFDQPGIKAMNTIAGVLAPIANEIKLIDLAGISDPENYSPGWDAADALAEGWGWNHFKNWAMPLIKVVQKSKPKEIEKKKDEPTEAQLTEVISARFPHLSKKGFKPLSTIENFKYLMDAYGVTIRYNVITKEEEILIPGQSFLIDNRANASIAWVISTMAKHEMPTGSVQDFISYLTGVNLYNPVAEWVKANPWDGTDRLQDLYNTVTINHSPDLEDFAAKNSLKELFIRKWMISAVAAAFEPNGVSAHGVLVFQGDQNIGKTSWLKALAPSELNFTRDGVLLRPDDKDSVKQTVSYWLVELGELDATFKRSDIAQLKAFLTKDKDVLRRAFARKESEYARRTVFFASVNPQQFLQDPTGNRRFWTIQCKDINFKHGINMQQTWAQVYEAHYLKGEKWFLDEAEIKSLNEHNEEFQTPDPIAERILSELIWDAPETEWTWRTATEILQAMGLEKPLHKEVATASTVIFKHNSGRKKKSMGLMKLFCPPKHSRIYLEAMRGPHGP